MNTTPILAFASVGSMIFVILVVALARLATRGSIGFGLLRRAAFFALLLVAASVVAMVATIAQRVQVRNTLPIVSLQQGGNSVKVTASGVELHSQSGDTIQVTPLGGEMNSRSEAGSQPAEPPAQPALPAEAPDQPATTPAASAAQPQQLLADHFDPDIYQSEGAAIRGLTNQIAKLLDTLTSDKQDPKAINIRGQIDLSFGQEMMNIVSKACPTASISTHGNWPPKPDANTIIITVSKEPQSGASATAPAGKTSDAPQVLRIDAAGPERTVTRSATFLNKPWVDYFEGYWSRNPGHNWIKALSHSPATSAAEAEQQAIDDAVSQLTPRVSQHMSVDAREALDWLLQRQIRAGLQDSGLIVDRFVQRFERPYGEIWQVALLIDATPKKIATLADKCDRVLAAQQRSFRQTALSIAGVVALVCVVYMFLNSVTRGYFVWTLRAGALAIIAGGVFLVLLLSHNEPAIEGFLR